MNLELPRYHQYWLMHLMGEATMAALTHFNAQTWLPWWVSEQSLYCQM